MAKMQVDKALIRDLAELLNETNLTEIEVEEGQSRIRVARSLTVNAAVAGVQPGYVAPAAAAPVAVPPEDDAAHPGAITSPMVGTAYTAAEPEAADFVTVGSQVQAGQTILIIEAMKVMNPIPAPRGGTVKKIMVTNSQPVEFGEILMIIE